MKLRILSALLWLVAIPMAAQTGTIQGHSFLGGVSATTSGLNSTNKLLGIIPHATISVYYTGTQNLAPITNSQGNANPFTSNDAVSIDPGGYLFHASNTQAYDVVATGGIPPNTYAVPVTLLTDVFPSGAGGGGGSGCTTFGAAGTFQAADGSGGCEALDAQFASNTFTFGVSTPRAFAINGTTVNLSSTSSSTLLGNGSPLCTAANGLCPAGSSVTVDGSAPFITANFDSTTPTAPAGNQNVSFQRSGNNISGYVPSLTSSLQPLYQQQGTGTYYQLIRPTACVPVHSSGWGATCAGNNAGGITTNGTGSASLTYSFTGITPPAGATLVGAYVYGISSATGNTNAGEGFGTVGVGTNCTSGNLIPASKGVNFAWPTAQGGCQLSTTSGLDTVQIEMNMIVSAMSVGGSANVDDVGIEVDYNVGPTPPASASLLIAPPLSLNNNVLGMGPIWPTAIYSTTVARLAQYAYAWPGARVPVSDGLTPTDCSSGGGTYPVTCVSDGASGWTGYSLSGSTVANALTVNSSGSGAASPVTFDGSAAKTISYNTLGASPLAGSTSLTTLGTVATGTWNANPIQPQYGGTGQDWHASSGVPLDTAGTFSLLSTTGTGSVVLSQSPTLSGTVDASGATQFKLPVAGGYVSAANGECGFDSTNGNWHCWVNGADALMIPLAGGFISGHCMQPTLSGTSWVGADAGAACGTGGGSGTMTDGAGSTTAGYFALTSSTAHAYTVDTNLDNGHTTANTLSYAGSGGIKASAGPLTSANPGGGVDSSFFLTQEGTVPSGLSASGQDNCYADSTQHGILCNLNAGTTLPLVQGPASDTTNDLAAFSGANGGKLIDTSILYTNVVTAASTLTSNALMTGAGSKAAQTVTTGTGVVTALGVNTGTAGAFDVLIASGTSAMGTGAISSGTCATVVTTSATGVATTDTIQYTPNTDPTAVTGYAPSASGSLYIWAYPTSGNVNFRVCNNTSGSLTPSALTLNWRVVR